jgi:plasmid stabilization system protein ParE
MNKVILVSNKSTDEIQKVVIWYEKQGFGLGKRFIEELDLNFNNIVKNPDFYKKVDKKVYRCLMKIFPYIIYFSEVGNEIIILRVRHKKQKPLKRYM